MKYEPKTHTNMKKLTKEQQDEIRIMYFQMTNSRIKADQAEDLLARQYQRCWTGSSWNTGLRRGEAVQYKQDAADFEALRQEHYRRVKRFSILALGITEEGYPEYKAHPASSKFSDL